MRRSLSQYNTDKRVLTLVELMVVVGIIGLITASTTVAIRGVRERARDARRLHDFRQLRTAVELYASKQPRLQYPIGVNIAIGVPDQTDCLSSVSPGFAAWPCDDPVLPLIPGDPASGTYNYSSLDGFSYLITATLEGTVEGMSGVISVSENGF